MIPESQYPETCLLQESCPFFVLASIISMLSSINFYDEFPVETNEIKNIPIIRMLPPELVTIDLPPPQDVPHPALSIGHIVSKRSLQPLRENTLVRLTIHPIPIPHLTSPLKGEEQR